MPEHVLFFIAAAVLLALIPLVPSMMRLRIAVLRWLHWNWLAQLHERHFDGFTLAARMVLAAAALIALILVLTNR